jgi:integrase
LTRSSGLHSVSARYRLPAYLIPELKRWKLACPATERGLVLPGEPATSGVCGPIEAGVLLRKILQRARRAGLPPLRFHHMRHLAGTLMSEAGVPPKRAQEIVGHADVRTTLAIFQQFSRNPMSIPRRERRQPSRRMVEQPRLEPMIRI